VVVWACAPTTLIVSANESAKAMACFIVPLLIAKDGLRANCWE
jgi:hypothetical protein